MKNKKQKGFTLIEILVSVTILTIGLLGILAMHLRSYTSVREAEMMGLASSLTESLAEAMRTNSTLVDSGVQDAQGNPIMKQRWVAYETTGTGKVVNTGTITTCTKPGSSTTASNLATFHLCNFENQFAKTIGGLPFWNSSSLDPGIIFIYIRQL